MATYSITVNCLSNIQKNIPEKQSNIHITSFVIFLLVVIVVVVVQSDGKVSTAKNYDHGWESHGCS